MTMDLENIRSTWLQQCGSCDDLTGISYTGTGRWGMASYRAMHWLYHRKGGWEREHNPVEGLFYGRAWR